MQDKNKSELTVIIKAKDLCQYITKITQKSPKQFRFTYISRLQNLAMDIIENLYRANDTFVTSQNKIYAERRLNYQHKALTDLRLLTFFSEMACQDGCILPKQYEQIAKQAAVCQNYLGAWITGDRKRIG
ncbi:MAG: four helix bundle protein [Lachnospiraceae bacterium]|nr:four helix bundle protein [Lachnospiraceae bacterium]